MMNISLPQALKFEWIARSSLPDLIDRLNPVLQPAPEVCDGSWDGFDL